VTLGVLAMGAGGAVHLLALLAWIAITAAIGQWYFARRRSWTTARIEMTDDLVERIVGHRTRLAQESPDHWHDGEEQLLEEYGARSKAVDRATAMLHAVVPRGWLIVGVLALVPAFVSGRASIAGFAIGLGGTLAAWRSFEKLAQGSTRGARLAWDQISVLFHAAARPSAVGSPGVVAGPTRAASGFFNRAPVMEADGLVFRYPGRAEPALAGAALRIQAGERVLLQGPSGGGKSTLASVLVGLRAPSSGLLLAGGLDRQTLGAAAWRRRAVSAPQFHENHVLTASLAFNLLMSRQWPAEATDFEEAEAVCRELGLGSLLDRMPSGLLQMVGESGWRLSHGERSRLFIARALLQRADFIVLDESFAALDPGTLQQAMRCVQRRAPTLMVIAHP
jgi:ATP-binding cassette subfamily B protein